MMKRRSGLTLIELILSVVILAMLIMVVTGAVRTASQGLFISEKQFFVQTTLRNTSDTITDNVIEAKAVFTIPQNAFSENKLEEKWDYFGLSSDGKEVVKYVYNQDTKTHDRSVVAPIEEGFKYNLVFKHIEETGRKMLYYTIQIIDEKTGNVVKELSTQIEAKNAKQVVDYSTEINPAHAFAYRSLEEENETVVFISLITDASGSMKYDMDGNIIFTNRGSRFQKLQDALNGNPSGQNKEGLIDKFSSNDNVFLTLVPFATTANYPEPNSIFNRFQRQTHPIYNLSKSREIRSLKRVVRRLNNLRWGDVGLTNTGDGLRRAYYRHKYFEDNKTSVYGFSSNTKVMHYTIILVDGVTTHATWNGGYSGDRNYERADGYRRWLNTLTYSADWVYYIPSILGRVGSENRVADNYVQVIGNMFKRDKIKSFVIGFSNVDADKQSVQSIAQNCGVDGEALYYSDTLNLEQIFDSIYKNISKDLWIIEGPSM